MVLIDIDVIVPPILTVVWGLNPATNKSHTHKLLSIQSSNSTDTYMFYSIKSYFLALVYFWWPFSSENEVIDLGFSLLS